ncbi:MAG: stage III sporulation protein AA [Alicyclobacillaceae bacterium]|uniref:stage III sporulation protein AA n=1 Tax=Alicyclobacillus sp. SP_1 TaxID=2942475 RepID=UPI002157F0F1|nr:stage III sporulation protein AA [Alicyclobacillus sp. SP_1]MCY0888943.1 stage III sporulation protein AA [Alicyclobacillaceae bacterium]MCY0896361.1 stage III sporulation protein AA [Alicyclobacillaceae bacterium]
MATHATNDAADHAVSLLQRLCPPSTFRLFEDVPLSVWKEAEEVRFRRDQPIQILTSNREYFLRSDGSLTSDWTTAMLLPQEQFARILQAVTQSSLYAVEEELRRGFITISGGHRVGVAGRAILNENGQVQTFRSIRSLALRIARERRGVANKLIPSLFQRGQAHSTLLLSPPQCGKTTLLRDLVRVCSYGARPTITPAKVTVIDERSELSGHWDDEVMFDLGPRTDVLAACPKAEGMMMAIRSLSPEIVVTDEIGRENDVDAILEAVNAGVLVFASAHAGSLEEWRRRPSMQRLFSNRAFTRYVLLSRRLGPCTVEAVYDETGQNVPK